MDRKTKIATGIGIVSLAASPVVGGIAGASLFGVALVCAEFPILREMVRNEPVLKARS